MFFSENFTFPFRSACTDDPPCAAARRTTRPWSAEWLAVAAERSSQLSQAAQRVEDVNGSWDPSAPGAEADGVRDGDLRNASADCGSDGQEEVQEQVVVGGQGLVP